MLALFNIEKWLDQGGLALAALIIFAETGLLIGFFLPGDSLLFIAGFLSSEAGHNVMPALPITAGVIFVAAVAGDSTMASLVISLPWQAGRTAPCQAPGAAEPPRRVALHVF